MRTPILSFALLLVGCAHAPTAEEDLEATPAEFAAGRTFAEEQCGTCHSVSGQTQSSVRNAPPFSQLGRNYAISSLAEALAEGMITGHDSMPEWELEPGEIRGLLAYIQSVQRP
jgi:cytochrome c